MTEYRNFDGSGNNLQHPRWGKAGEPLGRPSGNAYNISETGGLSDPSGPDRPNPRTISNIVCATRGVEHESLTDFVWAWGQFLDHELDLTEGADPREDFSIHVGVGEDPRFGGFTIPLSRSNYDRRTGNSPSSPRQQINQLSSFIDGANVYGATIGRAAALRTLDGTGRLRVVPSAKGDLLPYNTMGLPNAKEPQSANGSQFFAAGDIRANEHVILTSLHTLFVREHNRQCGELVCTNPEWMGQGELVFQEARRRVIAIMQAITFEEFLPALLGPRAIAAYQAYDDNLNPSISNVFSTACYRLGHSMLPVHLELVTRAGVETLALKDAFFAPELIELRGIEPFLAGLAQHHMQRIDTGVVDAVRNFLFANTGHGPKIFLDLAALNIQRGRDHGLPSYNECRIAFGLPPKISFKEITSDAATARKLKAAYGDVEKIDPWVGGLAEDHHSNAEVGEFIFTVLKDQFVRARNGDRFWYEGCHQFSEEERGKLKATRLSHVIKRNTSITTQDDVFRK